ncbi:MAG TPA: STAS domain-containing protein [Gammaproteobacteria bacterium]|nr:STAS domain-containing protein [Gammaproteobacteria bacterium]
MTSAVGFEPAGPGHYRVTGPLRFETAMEALEKSRELFAEHREIELDLQGVESTDSAGLALLVEWVGWAHREGRRILFHHLPPQLLALARISEVDKLLPTV